jgi:hypothetical protein
MSTPIKPPGGSPSTVQPGNASEQGRIESRPGEVSELVESARADEVERAVSPRTVSLPDTSRLETVRADLAAGRISVDQAVDRLVQHALANASSLPSSHRSALESQLRTALSEDPTLIALRKDLERGPSR